MTLRSSFCLMWLWLCASTHHSPNTQKPAAMLCIYPDSIFVGAYALLTGYGVEPI